MKYVDLDRQFVSLGKDEEPSLDIGRDWGHRIGGWLGWDDLLLRRRVVLLAEAASGKTSELENRARDLASAGIPAFFVPIEELFEVGLRDALPPTDQLLLDGWQRDGTERDAWFFLDSVDEARLHHRNAWERTLKRFAKELYGELHRIRIVVSCRASDWLGEADRAAIERLIPLPEQPAAPPSVIGDDALLAPIFERDQNKARSDEDNHKPQPESRELLVVQLIALDSAQRARLAEAAGVSDVQAFGQAIDRNGIDALAERPGDLIDMAAYWNEHGRFGSLSEMMESGIQRKLREPAPYRPDNQVLTPAKARQGAERIAAALTFARTFTLRAPGGASDPSPIAGALDPADILDDWNDAERNALIRRGIFAPSTYGRVRFHHRGTQEYLTACWLDRLLRAGCAMRRVMELIFASPYGVDTLVPSLHASTAWLAQRHSEIRDEVIRREPLVLLRYADPRSLAVDVKARLLRNYAERHRVGEIGNDSLDWRSLWLFASPDLAGAIEDGWRINNRTDFRIDLLRIIREGEIAACTHLAQELVLDTSTDAYAYRVAIEALHACGDEEGCRFAAERLLTARVPSDATQAAFVAEILFPRFLTVDEVLSLISHSDAPKGTGGDFGRILKPLWCACATPDARERLILGVADLCVSPPFVDEFHRVSRAHLPLAEELRPLARAVVSDLGNRQPSESAVRLLMAVERTPNQRVDTDEPSLFNLVGANPSLTRALFWADVEETRAGFSKGIEFYWQVRGGLGALWQLGRESVDWLTEDLRTRPLLEDRRIALSAIASILGGCRMPDEEVARLRLLVSTSPELGKDLQAYSTPPCESPEEQKFQAELKQLDAKREEEEREAKTSWIRFRHEIQANPAVLTNANMLADWGTGARQLLNLSTWLRHRAGRSSEEAAMRWQLLEEGFGRKVAVAYRDGMKMLWRITPPERPQREDGGRFTEKYAMSLSQSGIGIEASEDEGWARHLTIQEAERAAQHACLSESGYPKWLNGLVEHHPEVTLQVIREELKLACAGRHGLSSMFLSELAWSRAPIPSRLQPVLFETLIDQPFQDLDLQGYRVRILRRLELSADQRARLSDVALEHLETARSDNDNAWVTAMLLLLFIADPDRAATALIKWLDDAPEPMRVERSEYGLTKLFDRHEPSATLNLGCADVNTLDALVRVAYRHIPPGHDQHHEGMFRPNRRDKAETARNALLGVLLDRPGKAAYRAVRALADDVTPVGHPLRFNELAHAKAERDAEPPAWTVAETLVFERECTAPAKTGDALVKVVLDVLDDIQESLGHADATSRPLLQKADTEEELQQWLAEQTRLRARGRFHVHREAEVADRNEPDILISSTAAPLEVALELKHGEKGWTKKQLEHALKQQLAEDYLKPETRRHGVLVILHQGRKTWRDPSTRAKISFGELVESLKQSAGGIHKNAVGVIEVRVFGIDASASV